MPNWSKFTPDELERRRKKSAAALKELDRAAFAAWYQEHCDRTYWTRGPCCAGCDHWRSAMGDSGECSAAGIVSGSDVIRSMGVTFSSYDPGPGFPLTQATDHCGLFKDDFDWSSLGADYLAKIGAPLTLP